MSDTDVICRAVILGYDDNLATVQDRQDYLACANRMGPHASPLDDPLSVAFLGGVMIAVYLWGRRNGRRQRGA